LQRIADKGSNKKKVVITRIPHERMEGPMSQASRPEEEKSIRAAKTRANCGCNGKGRNPALKFAKEEGVN